MLSWLPPNVSTFGGQIDRLFYLIYYLTTATFFAVQLTLLAFLFIYRDRPGRRATYTHGNTTLEIVWTVIPAVILVVLALRQPLDVGRDQGDAAAERLPRSSSRPSSSTGRSSTRGPTGSSAPTTTCTMDNDFHVPVNKVVRIAAEVEGRHPQLLRPAASA